MMNLFFLIFVRQIPKVIQRPMDPPRLPLPQYGRHRKESSVHGRGKISNRAANSEFFMKNPLWKLSWILSRSWIAKKISGISTQDPPIFKRQWIRTCFRDIRKKILPAKAEEVAKVFSTVIPGDQVDPELCSRSREKIFEERKDSTLSGKLIKDPPVRGQFGEAFIELREGYKAKKQRPYEKSWTQT